MDSVKTQLKKRLGLNGGRPRDENPVCDSGIYCYGPLLDTIQMAHIYPDSKTFVDKKLKFSPGKIIKKFDELLKHNDGQKLDEEQIREFLSENFDDEGLELVSWTPEDWTPQPKFISELSNKQLIGLAKRINRLWRDLSRKISDDVKDNPQLYSIIYVPNGFVVPGGRFREFYYWDTYWIVKALLHCDMTTTVKGIIENFLFMVETYGLVPNGGRIYYTKRSQPPFLTLMMKEYMNKTVETDFLRKNLPLLEKELEFWLQQRSIVVEKDGQEHTMFVFGTGGQGPRPESYREDFELAAQFEDEDDREEFYYHMKAGAESGWDYSTRWMIDDQARAKGTLMDVKTNYIVPVDLNALMYMNYMAVAEFFSLLGDVVNSEKYLEKAETLAKAIKAVLWDEEGKMWFDYDFLNSLPRKSFYPSNLFPLWAECYGSDDRMMVAESAVNYLKNSGAIYCKGGVPTSLDESAGQQWDFPNAWPPLQHILVAGLLKTEHSEARKMALTIAKRYTEGTMFSCPDGAEVCNMFEKYDVTQTGAAGGGGEYDVQTGFGWSNGVVFEFIALFGDELLETDVDRAFDKSFKEEIELNTHFDIDKGKSKLLKRDSNVSLLGGLQPSSPAAAVESKVDSPICHHPALTIEEDEDEEYLANHYLSLKRQHSMSIHHGSDFSEILNAADYLLEGDDLEVVSTHLNLDEVIRQQARSNSRSRSLSRGRRARSVNSSMTMTSYSSGSSTLSREQVMVLENADTRLKASDSGSETLSVRISNQDVKVIMEDEDGPKSVPEVDIELEIPKSRLKEAVKRKRKGRKGGTLSRSMRNLFQRFLSHGEDIDIGGEDNNNEPDNVVTVKETVEVKDENGTHFSLDVDLKLKVEESENGEVLGATKVPKKDDDQPKFRRKWSFKNKSHSNLSEKSAGWRPWRRKRLTTSQFELEETNHHDLGEDEADSPYKSLISKSKSVHNVCEKRRGFDLDPDPCGASILPSGNGFENVLTLRRSAQDLFRFTTV